MPKRHEFLGANRPRQRHISLVCHSIEIPPHRRTVATSFFGHRRLFPRTSSRRAASCLVRPHHQVSIFTSPCPPFETPSSSTLRCSLDLHTRIEYPVPWHVVFPRKTFFRSAMSFNLPLSLTPSPAISVVLCHFQVVPPTTPKICAPSILSSLLRTDVPR